MCCRSFNHVCLFFPFNFRDIGEKFTSLRLLDAFGLVPDARVFSNTYEMKRVAVNTRAISTIARPTPVQTDVHSMWDRRCRLRFHY